ncbi:MAG: ATP-binding protein, partial [Bacillota bacterium]|nr:ATP-binding protein [Bacillota bacterium]
FRFNETEMMLAGMKREDIAVLHASLGGVAEYLSFVNPKKSLRENLIHLFFSKHGRMYVEPENLLNQELREPGLYHQILDAMANGASKNSEIATKVRMESGGIGKYLDSLIELGIIKKEAPFEGKSQRKSIYRISDGCYRFWYRFVNKNKSAIELGLGEDVYDERVKDELSDFMGYGFEQVAFDIIDELSYQKKLPGVVFNRGRWWGNNKKVRREEEIDYVGRTREGMIFAEIKWRSDKMNSSALKSLIEKSMLIDAPKRDYILVSKSGFTNELKKEAQKAGVVLYRFDKGILE